MKGDGKWNISLGIAANNVDPNDPIGSLDVIDIENTPFFSGEIGKQDKDITFTCEDGWSNRTHSTCKTSNVVPTVFFGRTNMTIPNVVKDEQVLIIRYGGDDKAYWFPTRQDDKLRKQEQVRIYAASDPTKIKVLGDDNTFFIEIDTRTDKKKIHLSTSKKDGESHRYDILMDAKNSMISINDDDDNKIQLMTDKTRILLQNKEGTKVDLDKKNIFLKATDSIYLIAENRIFTKSKMLMIDHVTGILKVITAVIKNCSKSSSC